MARQLDVSKPLLGRLRTVFRKQTVFLVLVVAAVLLGLGVGLWLHPDVNRGRTKLEPKAIYLLKFPGELFIRMMKLLVVPLAICANVSSLSSMRLKSAGFMGFLTVGCFLTGMLSASLNGCLITLAIRPGAHNTTRSWAGTASRPSLHKKLDKKIQLDNTIISIFLNLVPDNIFESLFSQSHIQAAANSTHYVEETTSEKGANIFGLLAFSILFGCGLQSLGENTGVVARFFHGCREALGWVVSLLIWYFPIGVFSMVAGQIAATDDLATVLFKVSLYVATMLVALSIQFLLLNGLFFLVTRRNPLTLIYDTLPAITCAIGTASSAATMPITLKCMRRASYTNNKVVRFILPLGTTLNMNGTAVLEAVAPIFLLQVLEREVSMYEASLTVFSGLMATMITGTMPSGGMLTMYITLEALQIDTQMVQLIYPVDWFLDRLRTPINVFGNAICTAVVSHYVDLQEAKDAATERHDSTFSEAEQGRIETMDDHFARPFHPISDVSRKTGQLGPEAPGSGAGSWDSGIQENMDIDDDDLRDVISMRF